MKTLFISPNTLKKSVLESQIFPLIYACNNTSFLISKFDFDQNTRPEKVNVESISSKGILSKVRIIKNIKPDYIYVRDPFDFFLCFILNFFTLTNSQLIYDFRGVAHEEMKFKNSKLWKCKIIEFLEKLAFKKAHFVSCVSQNMRLALVKKFGERVNFSVTPCGADFRFKKSIVAKEHIDFCYVGGLSKWQQFDEVCKTIKKLQQFPLAKFHILTNDISLANKKINEYGINKYNLIVTSLGRDDIPSYLKNMDYGFVFRENTFINKTASPIKVSEYVCAGIIPVLTSGVGDFYDLLISKKLGIEKASFELMTFEELRIRSNNECLVDELYEFSNDYSWKKIAHTHIINKLN